MASGEGTPFGRYRLLSLLGKGGMGQVFRAHDTETDRVVALKVLPPQLARDDKFKERFRREALAAARLSDPHVVPIHHFGEIDGQLYVDMRLIDGRDLGVVLRDASFTPARAVAIIAQVASALHTAHQAGLVHRDVKPSNVLVTGRDFAYLIDFGLVRATGDASLTATGFAMGTVSYMSPEQLGGQSDARSDVYALACVLFECLTGRQPFTGDMRTKLTAHASAPPPAPSRMRPGVSPAFDAVIARGMAKDPQQRYQTAPELADAARVALETPIQVHAPDPAWEPTQYGAPARLAGPQYAPAYPSPPYPPTRAPWWRQPAVLIGAAAAAAVAIVLTVVLVVVSTSGDDDAPAASASSSATAPEPDDIPLQDGRQTTLPFGSLAASSVAVDGSGTVYVGIIGSWILALEKGSKQRDEIRLTDRTSAYRMAVDADGTIFMVNLDGGVAELAPGSGTPSPLPFPKIAGPGGIALGPDGAIYVADFETERVLVLEAGARSADELVTGLAQADALAVDADGNLFVTTVTGVVKLAPGDSRGDELAGAPNVVNALAVDSAGNLYATSAVDRVVSRYSAGDEEWSELPFTGLTLPNGVAVDEEGNVYVLDGLDRVVKLAVD